MGSLRKLLRKRCKFLAGSEEARIDEVENRPQIPQTVFHRRARQRDASPRFELLDRACLFGAWILDSLGFVNDCEVPGNFQQFGNARQRSVAGYDKVYGCQNSRTQMPELGSRHCRRVRDDRLNFLAQIG